MHLEVVVADTRATARQALRTLVEGWGWSVVAEAHDELSVVVSARRAVPDAVIADASIRDSGLLGGLEQSGVTVVRLLDRPQEHASMSGAAVLKGVPEERLREVIEAAVEAGRARV